jgi:P-type Ca2+ transporter type 2C
VIGAAAAVFALLLYVPFLRELFAFAPMQAADVLLVAVVGIASVLWFEAFKLISQARRRGLEAARGKIPVSPR